MDILITILEVLATIFISFLSLIGLFAIYTAFKLTPHLIKYRKALQEVRDNYDDVVVKSFHREHKTIN